MLYPTIQGYTLIEFPMSVLVKGRTKLIQVVSIISKAEIYIIVLIDSKIRLILI